MEQTSKCSRCGASKQPGNPCTACVLEHVLSCGMESDNSELTKGSTIVPQSTQMPDLNGPSFPVRFGNYELLREIAVGGMGAVYEARELQTSRMVALKLLRCLPLASESDRERFRLEAGAAARLDHPNIVPLFEVGECYRQPYFTMKLMSGGSLEDALKAGSLVPKVGVEILIKIARATHHAHQHGVLHRDLKPGNVIFDQSGEPYLTDFGLAKLTQARSKITQSASQLGTPEYMSPEQASGRIRDITVQSDVWSLGVILYRVLTGRLPFEGDNHLETFQCIMTRDPAPLGLVRSDRNPVRILQKSSPDPSISRLLASKNPPTLTRVEAIDIETICLKALQKLPSKRFATAEEFASELERWMRGDVIESRRTTRTEMFYRWIQRNRLVAALTLGSTLGLMALTVESILLWRSSEVARQSAEQRAVNLLAARASEAIAREDISGGVAQLATLFRGQHFTPPMLQRAFGAIERFPIIPLSGEHPNARPIADLAVSPDSRRVVVIDEAGWARILRTETMTKELDFHALPDGVSGFLVEFSPNGRWLLASGGRFARIWDSTRGIAVGSVVEHLTEISCGTFGPSGQWFATGTKDGLARIWETMSGKPLSSWMTCGGPIAEVIPTPDGSKLITTTHQGEVLVWNVSDGSRAGEVLGHPYRKSPGFVPSRHGRGRPMGEIPGDPVDMLSRFRLTAGADWFISAGGTGLGFGSVSGRKLETFIPTRAPVYEIDMDYLGRYCVAGGGGNGVDVWDLSGRFPVVAHHLPWASQGGVFIPGRQAFVTRGDRNVVLCDATTGQKMALEVVHPKPVDIFKLTSDGQLLLTVDSENTIRAWSLSSQVTAGTNRQFQSKLRAIDGKFSPDFELLVLSSNDAEVELWRKRGGEWLRQEPEPEKTLLAAKRYDEGLELIAFVKPSGDLQIQTHGTVRMERAFNSHPIRVQLGDIKPFALIQEFFDKTHFKLWKWEESQGWRELGLWDRVGFGTIPSPEGGIVLICQPQSMVGLDAETGLVKWTIPLGTAPVDPPYFSQTGNRFGFLTIEGGLQLIESESGRFVTEALNAESEISQWSFGASEEEILAISKDGSLRVWRLISDLGAKNPVVIQGREPFIKMAVNSKSGQVATLTSAGFMELWDYRSGYRVGSEETDSVMKHAMLFDELSNRVVTVSSRGICDLIDWPRLPSQSLPSWFPDFMDAYAGKRQVKDGGVSTLPWGERVGILAGIQQQVIKGRDPWSQWAAQKLKLMRIQNPTSPVEF